MTRNLRPRPAVVLRPSYVSDATCFAILGITPRKFRERIVPRCERVSRLGHTVAVELEEAERAMRALSSSPDEEAIDLTRDDDEDDQPQTPDEFLARLGRERVA
jgi:hypothetical protein